MAEKKIPVAAAPNPEAGLPANIAAVVTGKAPPDKLNDSDLETAIGFLHRTNPPRIVLTDKCITEYHKRHNPLPAKDGSGSTPTA